jgi:D-alanine-D-alanine ligase
MKIVLLHTAEAAEPEPDPVIGQISGALHSAGHAVETLAVDDKVEPVLEAFRRIQPDLVFNIAESFGGRSALESNVAALLTLLGVRYTGSGPAGLLLAGDKGVAKKVLSFHGLKTPEFATLYRGTVDWAGNIDFPVIVKPPLEDGSLGLHSKSVVRDLKELLVRLDEVHSQYGHPVLIEQFIEGREFYVGVLGNSQADALPIVELDFSGFPDGVPRIASWEAKWGEEGNASGAEFAGTKSVIATDLGEELETRIRQVCVDAFHALQLRDYGRVDLRMTPNGDLYILEVNPNCYLEQGSEFAMAAAHGGLAYPALIGRIVELAAGRYAV